MAGCLGVLREGCVVPDRVACRRGSPCSVLPPFPISTSGESGSTFILCSIPALSAGFHAWRSRSMPLVVVCLLGQTHLQWIARFAVITFKISNTSHRSRFFPPVRQCRLRRDERQKLRMNCERDAFCLCSSRVKLFEGWHCQWAS